MKSCAMDLGGGWLRVKAKPRSKVLGWVQGPGPAFLDQTRPDHEGRSGKVIGRRLPSASKLSWLKSATAYSHSNFHDTLKAMGSTPTHWRSYGTTFTVQSWRCETLQLDASQLHIFLSVSPTYLFYN